MHEHLARSRTGGTRSRRRSAAKRNSYRLRRAFVLEPPFNSCSTAASQSAASIRRPSGLQAGTASEHLVVLRLWMWRRVSLGCATSAPSAKLKSQRARAHDRTPRPQIVTPARLAVESNKKTAWSEPQLVVVHGYCGRVCHGMRFRDGFATGQMSSLCIP